MSDSILSSYSETDDYIGSFMFSVEIEGIEEINQSFMRVSGVKSNTEPMEFMKGTDKYVRKGIGRTTWDDVTLERVYNGKDPFYSWRTNIENGDVDRRTVIIYVYNNSKEQEVVRYITLLKAWPSAWELPELDASGSSPAVERITLTVDSIEDI